tara:strand:+ start:604 stop:969 length:366 start_codon:yes stop_codon:yes gene_type:complete
MKKTMMVASASFFTGLMMTSSAHAGGNNISSIASNIVTSIQDLPSLISALSYLFGLLLAVLGVMKIKDHVENPTQTPLSHGAIRLAAGGGLFALPIITESMLNLVGDGTAVSQASLNQVTF